MTSQIRRFSSRREKLDKSFLVDRLRGARAYDRIAGYFCSSLFEVAGEELESIDGKIRVVGNSELSFEDVQTARSANMAIRRSWCLSQPEKLVESGNTQKARQRLGRLYDFLRSGKMEVRILPNHAFGLVHGKAGIITLSDSSKTCFLGSVNESKSAWQLNYELLWEDTSPEAIKWVQEEFDALWNSPYAIALSDFVVEDIARLAKRELVPRASQWEEEKQKDETTNPAPVLIETPVYRKEFGLWEHQKYFVKLAFDAHQGPIGRARFVLADQVGLGKTLQLAMTALLIALTGENPILIICPKTLIWQWQGEMRDLLDVPSAVWNGKHWIDENGIEYPENGAAGIRKCPRRIGIVSSGLIIRRSESSSFLLNGEYDCVILDEAHRARRRNLGENRDKEAPDSNNLKRFLHKLAFRTRSLLLATATPVQLRPIEAWDLLDILSEGDESVLGNPFSPWRHPQEALSLVMGQGDKPESTSEKWEWIRNPIPEKNEHRDFEIIRRRLEVNDDQSVIPGDFMMKLTSPDLNRLEKMFSRIPQNHNPFIRRIVRRTRQQLENQIDPETNEPLLQRIRIKLFGESDREAIVLPLYLKEAYQLAEEFCRLLGNRMKGSGFLRTLLLRRVGSTMHAGLKTAERMLQEWDVIERDEEEDEEEIIFVEDAPEEISTLTKTLTEEERRLLQRFIESLETNKQRDPKYEVVRECLVKKRWLERGCIVFSQYRESIMWLAEQLSEEFPNESIAVYSGPHSSGVMKNGVWTSKDREDLKKMVFKGELRLMLGTDAASEGLNLQRLSTLINLDLPWNPTRLEQRKGRIQRIGQIHDTVFIYNMRYKDSVEDRVHQLLSSRLEDIYNLFGQLPDVLEDAWIAEAMGEKEKAKKIIDEVPQYHPFEIRYSKVEKIDWESCSKVLDNEEKKRILKRHW